MITPKTLKRQRERLGKLQAQVAKDAKVDPAYICRIEKGQQLRTLQRAERILNAYGFEVMPIGGLTVEEAVQEIEDWNEFEEQK